MTQEKNHASSQFSSRLRDEMEKFGLSSAADLAKFAGVAWSTANQWLNGAVPRRLALLQLASQLEVTATWLETGEGVKEPVNLQAIRAARNRANAGSEITLRDQAWTPDALPDGYLSEIIKLSASADLSQLLDTMESLSKNHPGDPRVSNAVGEMAVIVRNRLQKQTNPTS